VAGLAARLTERDRRICRLLAEHRVLTTHQLTEFAFGHLDTAEDRLRTLTTLEVLGRVRPRRDTGSAPYHYVLGPAGAAVVAAEQGVTVAELGYRRAEALAIALSRRLPEILRANGFYAALAGYARRHRDTEFALWLPEQRCRERWARLVQPHGFGHWREREAVVGFFLECHSHEEPVRKLYDALAGYDELAHATPKLATIVCAWIDTAKREAELHRALPRQRYLPPPLPPARTPTPPRPSGCRLAADRGGALAELAGLYQRPADWP
jgi:Replication-relaxation